MIQKKRQEEYVASNEIRFLVATDVHLGHKEKHPIRKNDSFEAFDEVLYNAKAQDVDFLLLGGDLFDQVNPSSDCFYRCLNSLRNNIFGNRENLIDITLNGEEYPTNFNDKNLNISLPILTIHGNHDYPSSNFGKTSVCDLLQASNYVTYFGKQLNLHQFTIRPLIITKKGTNTKIALYGLGYIKDPIVNDLFQEGKAVFQKPVGDLSQYMTIFVLHQNRYKKGFRAGAPQVSSFMIRNIPEWINLTIWGHEHEAIYKVDYEIDRCIFQPGSTVLTSYIDAQSVKKQCALITANKTTFNIESIPLERSFRPMFVMNLEVAQLRSQFGEGFILEEYLSELINKILNDSIKINQYKKPIIRIKIQHTGMNDVARTSTVQNKYYEMVANRQKIVTFWKRKKEKTLDVSDKEMLKTIKEKKSLQLPSYGIHEQIEEITKNIIDTSQDDSYPKNFFTDFRATASRQPSALSSLIRKRYAQQYENDQNELAQQMNKLNKQKELQFKKSMLYLSQKRQFINHGTIPKQYNSEQEFKKKEENIMNPIQFESHCRFIEESAQTQLIKSKNKTSKESLKNNNGNNRRGRIMEEETHPQRNESQDCCQRAQKQSIDQESNRINLYHASKQLEKIKPNPLKKGPQIEPKNKKKQHPPPRQRNQFKGQKIRFSEDLI